MSLLSSALVGGFFTTSTNWEDFASCLWLLSHHRVDGQKGRGAELSSRIQDHVACKI